MRMQTVAGALTIGAHLSRSANQFIRARFEVLGRVRGPEFLLLVNKTSKCASKSRSERASERTETEAEAEIEDEVEPEAAAEAEREAPKRQWVCCYSTTYRATGSSFSTK